MHLPFTACFNHHMSSSTHNIFYIHYRILLSPWLPYPEPLTTISRALDYHILGIIPEFMGIIPELSCLFLWLIAPHPLHTNSESGEFKSGLRIESINNQFQPIRTSNTDMWYHISVFGQYYNTLLQYYGLNYNTPDYNYYNNQESKTILQYFYHYLSHTNYPSKSTIVTM